MPEYGQFGAIQDTSPESLTRLNDMLRYLFYIVQGRIKTENLTSELQGTVNDVTTSKQDIQQINERLDNLDIVHPSTLEDYIRITDVINTTVTRLMANGGGTMYTDEDGDQVSVSADGLGAICNKNGAILLGRRPDCENGFTWTAAIDSHGIYIENVVAAEIDGWHIHGAQIDGVHGTFEQLIAGDEDAAHIDMGRITDNNEPGIIMYDSNNQKQIAITKNGVLFGNNGTMVKYSVVKPSGTKYGIGIFFE